MTGKMTSPTTALIFLLTISSALARQAEVVDTTLGPIQGLRQTVLETDVDVYYGIPYAKPPLGELRFKLPEPAEPWTNVRSATIKPNACFQFIDTSFERFPGVDMWNPNTPMSEDCLYLNVWVPRGSGSEVPKTTMVWIYGGGFNAGSSMLDMYNGSKLAVTHDVIVASLNYRVGSLGFFYTGTQDAPGNQGFLDQTLALEWIYKNVISFGGRQDSITIFGESAGSISVGFHLMSPLSMNYFTRGIMQSGSPNMETMLMPRSKAAKRAQKLAAMFSCPVDMIPEMVQCLQQVSAENLTTAQWALLTPGLFLDLPFLPVIDEHFLKEHPLDLLAKGAVKDTELLIGTNKDEGMFFLLHTCPELFPLNNSGNISDADFQKLVHYLNFNGDESVDKAVKYEYFDRMVPAKRDSYRNVASDISGDCLFICPVRVFANAFASLNGRRDVYMYSFEHHFSNNPWPQWTGVMHGYEIEAVFGLPVAYNYTRSEEALSTRMTGYWTRFAKNGSPNEGSSIVWPKLTSREAKYLKLTAQGDRVGQGLRYQQCTFRSIILPMLQRHESTTNSPECLTGAGGTSAIFLLLILLSTLCVHVFLMLLM